MMKKLCFIFFIGIFVSCKTNLVYIHTTDPAPVTIPNSAKNAGIVNRSVPTDDNKALNTMHQALSVENLKLIKEAGAEGIAGLNNALTENKCFEMVKSLNQLDLRTPVAGSFPSQLPWKDVETICKDNGVDILFVLEVFDSQLKVIPLTNPTKINTVTDVINNVTQAQVDIVTTVKTGWRIYDPKNKYILDEFPQAQDMVVTANASTAINTVEAMLGRKEAIKQSANRLGRIYADRIIPYRITITRDYYVKGTQNFKIAMRKARTGNWEGAGELWLKDTQSAKRKIAGRACYNMAILNEINDDLEAAIKWAQTAYENYNNKLALGYVNNLKYRLQKRQKLQYQQQN
ncbi:MAG: DUF6340 family protein [Bacteroidota bacterium]